MKRTVIAEGVLEREVFAAPTAIVSDLHMNGAGKQDNFQRALFLEWLRSLPEDWDLVCNGDSVDLWECPNFSLIWENNEPVLMAALSREGQDVLGNHDEAWACDNPYGLVEQRPLVPLIETPYLRIEHGHRLDPACSGRGSWIGRAATAVWAFIERIGLGPALQGIADRLCAWSKRRLSTTSKRGDDNIAYEYEADRLDTVLYVTGHTHRPALVERKPGRFYANAGSWVESGTGFIVEVEGRMIRLIEVSDGQ